MTTYLSGGWYRPGKSGGLRTEVIDGAMDAAGYLHRAGVGPSLLTSLALKVRSMMTLIDPQMKSHNGFGESERAIVAQRLAALTDESPELHGFVSDCLEHVGNRTDLMAFYLHLVHVTRMLQLLGMAKSVFPTGVPAWQTANAPVAAPKKPAKKPAAKKAAGKKTAKKRGAKKAAAKARRGTRKQRPGRGRKTKR